MCVRRDCVMDDRPLDHVMFKFLGANMDDESLVVDNDDPAEERRIRYRRKREALRAGLTVPEAKLFADSGVDIRWLRLCVKGKCSPSLMASILL